MVFYRVLSSWLFKAANYFLLACCLSSVITSSAIAEFQSGKLHIGSTEEFILRIKGTLDAEALAIFDREPLRVVASSLSQKFGVPVYVASKSKERVVEIAADGDEYRDVLKQITAQTGTFLVYRDGFIMFSPTAELRMKLSSQADNAFIQAIAKSIESESSRIIIDGNSLVAKVTRTDLLKLRSEILGSQRTAKITSTDLVIDGFEAI